VSDGGHLPARRGATAPADVLRQQFAPDASDADLAYFAQVARHMDVDPWAGHICLIPFQGIYRPTLTVAGRRFIAQRTGRLRGIQGPEWCGPRRLDRDGNRLPLEWLEVWDEDTPPYAARCLIHVDGWNTPANGTVKWDEFRQTTTDKRTHETRLVTMWERFPSHMLGKCAESLALRRGFSEVAQAVAYLGDTDDTAVMREVAAEAFVLERPPAPSSPPAAADRGEDAGPPPPPPGPPPPGRRGGGRRRVARSGVYDNDQVPDWVRDQSPEAQR